MKVLQINAVSGIRSTGRICVEISDYLNGNDHESYIAYSSGIAYEKGYKIGTPIETKLHSLFSRIIGTQAYFSQNGTKKLLRYIDNLKPDVVHLHNLHANYINLELLTDFLANKDIPTVLTLHDCWFYTGKCTHYTVDGCSNWQTGCGNCPRLKKDNPSWFFDKTKKMFKDKNEWFSKIPRVAVVGVSDWIINEAKYSFLSSANILTRIYNWVDYDVFKPVETNLLKQKLQIEDKFIILGVSSIWSNAKGLDKFIQLAGVVSNDIAIIIVGNIKSDVHLPENIIHIKETHDVNELVEYYSMADVFLNLSIEETFGKVTAEALACGTPAITINSTANPELIGQGCGYISRDNLSEIFENINKIKKNGKVTYSEDCINYVKNKFNKNDRIMDYMGIYRKLIDL